MSFPKIDQLAPNFTLLDQNNKKVSLRSFKGEKNVILYFYPKAMTPGCTVQACGLRDQKKKLGQKKTVVLAVSPDSPERLMKFQEKYDLNFTLLSDVDHKVSELYGVWGKKKFMGKEYMGVHRITFFIGKDGKLKHVMEKVKTKTHHDDVFEFLGT